MDANGHGHSKLFAIMSDPGCNSTNQMFWSKRSGLQTQVLRLYRDFLRASNRKGPDFKNELRRRVREEFRKYQGLRRGDIEQIEHLIRRGRKQLEALSQSSVVGITTFNINKTSST